MMKLYRISWTGIQDDNRGEHQGYSYHRSKREVALVMSQRREFAASDAETITIRNNLPGIILALNKYGSHADNG